MNAEPTHDFREQAEARIVALLLGEASPFEEAAVQDLLQQDARLAAFHEEMKRVLSLVQAASAHGSEAKAAPAPPPQLSPERRQALLQTLAKPASTPAALVPFPFWRRRWFLSAAAAASVLGLLGWFLWIYPGSLRPKFRLSQATATPSTLTFSEQKFPAGRHAKNSGAQPQPLTGPESGLAKQKVIELGRGVAVKPPQTAVSRSVSVMAPAQIVLPVDAESRRGVAVRGNGEVAVEEARQLFNNGMVAKDAEVALREAGAVQTPGTAGAARSRDRQSSAAERLGRNLNAPPASMPPATVAPAPSAGTVLLPTGGRMTQYYLADTDRNGASVATGAGKVDDFSSVNVDLMQVVSDPAGSNQPVDSYGTFSRGSGRGGAAATDGSSGGFGGGGGGGGGGDMNGRALDRTKALADKAGAESEQGRMAKIPQSPLAKSIVLAEPAQAWDEKKLAAGYPVSAGALVVLPQGEAKSDGLNVNYSWHVGQELKRDVLRDNGVKDQLSGAALGKASQWGMVADKTAAPARVQETKTPQTPIVAQNGGAPTLGDTPMLGRLFQPEGAGATAATKMVPLKVQLPKLAFVGTPADDVLDEHIESPEETQAKRDALLRLSMIEANAAHKTESGRKSQTPTELGLQRRDDAASAKIRTNAVDYDLDLAARTEAREHLAGEIRQRGDAASADSKSRATKIASVPAPTRTDFSRKLAEEPMKAGKPAGPVPAAIAPSQTAVTELALTKEKTVEQESLARSPRVPPPTPQPEMETRNHAFSTFSLNVSDVSFRLASASLEEGAMPDPASIRSEEFVNAFDYRDPLPRDGARVSLAWERARYPFAHNREILRLAIRTAARGREPGRPLNLVVALDHSGSMERADRVAIVQEAMKVLAGQLQPQDRISVILFARTAQLCVDGLAGGHPQELLNRLRELNPQGGTNLEDALALAYQTALKHFQTNGNNRVVLMTDGAANLGNVDPNALQQTVESHRKKGIALDCFGIGWEGFNDDLLEVLARHGDGRYGFLNSVDVVKADFANQLAGALQVAAADVKAQVEFNPRRVTTFRQIGYARHQLTKEQFRDNTVDAAEIGAAESGNALYVIQVNPQGEGPLGVVRVRFKVPATGEYQEQSWDLPFPGRVTTLDQSAASLRLASAAAALAEWLAHSPYAAEVNLGSLESHLSGVAETFAPDPRPQRLVWMIRQARAVSGK